MNKNGLMDERGERRRVTMVYLDGDVKCGMDVIFQIEGVGRLAW